MSNLMILAASVFEISCGKADRHTDKRGLKPSLATAVGWLITVMNPNRREENDNIPAVEHP